MALLFDLFGNGGGRGSQRRGAYQSFFFALVVSGDAMPLSALSFAGPFIVVVWFDRSRGQSSEQAAQPWVLLFGFRVFGWGLVGGRFS